jgi:hypothetical protein
MNIGAFQSDMFGEGSNKFGETPEETKRPIDSSPNKSVDAPPFQGGGIVAEENKKAPTQPGGETPTDQPTEEEPKFKINPLILIGAGIAAFLFFKKRK